MRLRRGPDPPGCARRARRRSRPGGGQPLFRAAASPTAMKILFAGLGGIGQRHLRNLRQLRGDRVEVLAWRQRGLKTTLTEKLQVEAGADRGEKKAVCAFPGGKPAL